jgi:hypothetical protein
MNGSVPYRWVYQAIEPAVNNVTDASVARELANVYEAESWTTAFRKITISVRTEHSH